MKQLKLFATLLFAIGGGNALAQTDVTVQYLQNPSFELSAENTKLTSVQQAEKAVLSMYGWTETGVTKQFNNSEIMNASTSNSSAFGKLVNPSDGDFYFFARQGWNTSANNHIILTSNEFTLPSGKYELSVDYKQAHSWDGSHKNSFDTKLSLAFNSNNSDVSSATSGAAPASPGDDYFNTSDWQTLKTSFTINEATTGNVVINFAAGGGVRSDFVLDNVRLVYVDLTYYKNQFDAKKTEAEELLNSDTYKNITGEERTKLKEIADGTYSTIEEYEQATESLTSAMTTFTSAKSSYDDYVTEKSVADKLGLTYEAPTSATNATEKVKELNVAEFNAVEKDYTTAIELGTWTTSGAANFNSEHWSGTTHNYLNQIDGKEQGYNSSNWSMTCEQTLTLPAGEYVFKAAGRKSVNAYMNLIVKSGEDNIGMVSNFPNGNVGIGITTDGKASFDTNDKFARTDNTGYGWQWRFVPFTLTEETAITFYIEAGSTVLHNWASLGDYTVLAKPNTEASNIAYNQAVDAANQAIKDYAYITGAELIALQEAIAADKGTTIETIDAATEKVKDATQALIAAAPSYKTLEDAKALVETELTYASATKYEALATAKTAIAVSAADAVEKTNAITLARRAYVESNGKAEGVEGAKDCTDKLAATKCGDTMPDVTYAELRVNSGDGATDSEGNKTAKYFDTSGTFWGSNNLTARLTQEATGLASGKYLLTVQARGSSNLKSLVLTAGNASLNLDVQHPSNLYGAGWDDYSLVAEVGNSGSFSIKIEGITNAKQAWFSFNDFRLVRIGDLDAVSLDEATNNTIEAGVAKVTLKRSLAANKWNTLVLPFDVADADAKNLFGDDVKIAKYSNSDEVNIKFNTDEEGIKANVPVLIMPTKVADDNTYVFDGATLVSGEATAEGSAFDFVGSYDASYQLANDEYMLYGDKWWKTEEGDTYKIKAFRAYIKAKTAQAAKSMNLVIDGQTTGLKLNTVTGNVEGETYNLAGQRVANSYKGIVVKNGKKMIKK